MDAPVKCLACNEHAVVNVLILQGQANNALSSDWATFKF